jgi:RNA methyltransferase, TrmH family
MPKISINKVIRINMMAACRFLVNCIKTLQGRSLHLKRNQVFCKRYNRGVTYKRIDSLKNPTLKTLVELKERKTRDQKQRYLIEGVPEVSRALQAGEAIGTLLYVPELLSTEGQEIIGSQSKAERLELSPEAFAKLSLRQNPDGLIAVATIRTKKLSELSLPNNALVLVIEGLEKPGNIGALLRTADGANLDAVFITGQGTDLYNPNVIRASMGSLFSRPVLVADTQELVGYLTSNDFKILAATPHTTQHYWNEDFTQATAIVLGTEHEGLSKIWLSAATSHITIPMNGLADSLNVATAGALLMYEALRQRSKS